MSENNAPDELSQLLDEASANLGEKPRTPLKVEPLIPGRTDPSKDIFVVSPKLSPAPTPKPAIIEKEAPEQAAPANKNQVLNEIDKASQMALEHAAQLHLQTTEMTAKERAAPVRSDDNRSQFDKSETAYRETGPGVFEAQTTGELKIEQERTIQLRDNLLRLNYYIRNAETVEREWARLKDRADKAAEGAKTIASINGTDASEENKQAAAKAFQELTQYETQSVPAELRGEQPFVPSDKPSEVEKEYAKNVPEWTKLAREKQQEAIGKIAEEDKTPRERELEAKLAAAEAAQKAAEADAARLREEAMKLSADRMATETEAEQLPTPPPREAEPVLEMEELEAVAPVDTRNRFEKMRDGIVNGVKAWFHNLDPRDKDWAWRIGAVTGVTESTLTSIAVVPGGRIAVSALNFLAAQGVYAGVKVAEKVAISRLANEGPVENDRVQAILDARERYKNADHKIRNFFMGLSAGMTVGAITTGVIHAAYGAVEGFVAPHPVVATEAPKVIIKEAIKPFGWTPGAEVAPSVEIFNPKIIIPDNGNFWSAWHIDSSFAANWTDLHNGTTHTDVIKDMVIKLARANGHELGLVHAGDQIELAKVLTPEQLELVKKATAAKSYGEYTSAIKPAYQVLLKK